jgi:hypothetical protein
MLAKKSKVGVWPKNPFSYSFSFINTIKTFINYLPTLKHLKVTKKQIAKSKKSNQHRFTFLAMFIMKKHFY